VTTKSNDLPLQSSLGRHGVSPACQDRGIENLHFHDLRHEGTSRLFEAGFAIEQVSLVTGHKDWKMLRRYTHLKPEALHAIAAGRAANVPISCVCGERRRIRNLRWVRGPALISNCAFWPTILQRSLSSLQRQASGYFARRVVITSSDSVCPNDHFAPLRKRRLPTATRRLCLPRRHSFETVAWAP